MSGSGRDEFERHAIETPFDPANCDIIDGENVQDAIEDLCQQANTSASPGFTWGSSGNVTANSWLLNDTVPSNKSGRAIFIADATLEAVFVRCELAATFDIEIYEHDGVTYTLVTTVNIVATRGGDFPIASLALTNGKELALKLVNGSAKNVVAGCVLRGTF
jgi:hypothetical protein